MAYSDTGQHMRKSSTSNPSRRGFLTTLAALGAGAILPAGESVAQKPAAQKPHLIDLHHHIFPPVYMAAARDRIVAQNQAPVPPAVANWTAQSALAEMDRTGVATAVLSISTPGIWFGDEHAARRLARQCNEYAAQLVKDHPRRFGFFASVPLPDREGSLREIEYALDVLRADGVCLLTSYGDRWPGDPAFAPVFEELNRRKAVVHFHPTGPDCCRNLMPYVPYMAVEVPHDTTRAVTSLLYSGAFTRLRDIRFIFSHAGGTIPMLAGRIAGSARIRREIAERLPEGVEYELKRLYYDVANSANRPAIAALTSLVPTSHIVFGSDYPYSQIDVTADGMSAVELSANDLQAIHRDNAIALFPRLKGS